MHAMQALPYYQRCNFIENPILFSVSKPALTAILINSRTCELIQLFVFVYSRSRDRSFWTKPRINAVVVVRN